MKLQDIVGSGKAVSLAEVAKDIELLKQIQIRLRDLQMPVGADGRLDSATSAAIARFCKAFDDSGKEISPEIAKQLIQCKAVPGCNPLLELVTSEMVTELIPNCSLSDTKTYLPGVLQALQEQSILNRSTLVAAIATIGVETAGFRPIEEWGGKAYFTEMYEGRSDLGNTQPGDGARYYGRGFVQITGRANYREYGKQLGCQLEENPDLALDPKIAARILARYFCNNGVDKAAKQDDWQQVRRLVNGGLNGWDEFYPIVQKAQKIL